MTERNHPAKTQAARNSAVSWPTLTRPTDSRNAPPAVRAGTQSGGQTLDKHTQATMSARFGHDFSQVRIHTDHRAEDSAAAIGANAYAVGSDIVFGAGKYTPGSRETERLLAHELTHVAQQGQLGGGDWGRMSQKGDASESEADSLAAQVMMGRNVQVQAMPGAAIARDEEPNASYVYGPSDAGYSSGGVAGVSGEASADTRGSGYLGYEPALAKQAESNNDTDTSSPSIPNKSGVPDESESEPEPTAGRVFVESGKSVGTDTAAEWVTQRYLEHSVGPIAPALTAPFEAASDRSEEGERKYQEEQAEILEEERFEEYKAKMEQAKGEKMNEREASETIQKGRDGEMADMLAHH